MKKLSQPCGKQASKAPMDEAKEMLRVLTKRYRVDAVACRVLADIAESLQAVCIMHAGAGVDWAFLEQYCKAMLLLAEVEAVYVPIEPGDFVESAGEGES
jgi:hypothetical protein